MQWKAVAIGKESEKVLGMLESCFESSDIFTTEPESLLRSIYNIVSSPAIWGSLEDDEQENNKSSHSKSGSAVGVSQVGRSIGCDVYVIKKDDKGGSFLSVQTNITSIDEFNKLLLIHGK